MRLPALWQSDGPLQWVLRPLSWLYGALVSARRGLFAAGVLATRRLRVPVIVVGNRVAGGAGKTPTLLALVARLRAAGWHPGVVSRGYGRRDGGCRPVEAASTAQEVGDEPLLIHRRAAVPVWVGRDRVAAAQGLCTAHPEVDVVVCDDGLQHLRLARDIEIVVFDERGAGNGALLPAGPLREPLQPASRAITIVLYNAPGPTTPLPGHLSSRGLQGAVSLADWWAGAPATPQALEALRQRPGAVAAAGVARPQRFFDALRAVGLSVHELALPDHHDHAELPWPAGAADVVITEKDAVKLAPQRVARERPGTRVWVVPLQFEPAPAFFEAVLEALRPLGAPGHPTAGVA